MRYYVEGNAFEGKKVSIQDIQTALDEAKRLKVALEATASPGLKADEGYKETMGGFA